MTAQPSDLAKAFDTFNSVRLQSPTLERIWREGFGDEYADEARPNAFYPKSVFDRIIRAVPFSGSSRILLDIGCGHGLTGLYLASRLHMSLYGIDISSASIGLAREQAAKEAHFAVKSSFWVADARSTGLQDGECAAAVCMDVMPYFPDRPVVLKEIARILKPEGIFAFTTWEQKGYSSRLAAQQDEDYRPLLEEAGFGVKTYEVVDRARELQAGVLSGLIEQEEAVKAEIGERPAAMLANMARNALNESSSRTYVLGIVQRRAQT